MDERDYGEILDLTYGAAVEPELWPQALVRMGGAFGAIGATMMDQDQVNRGGVALAVGPIDEGVIASFFGHYAHINPLIPRVTSEQWLAAQGPTGIITDQDRMPKPVLMRSEFYNDFMRPLDFHSTATIGLYRRGLNGVTIDLIRPRSAEPWSAEDVAQLAGLQPHLIRAYHLTTKLSALRRRAGEAAELMERSPYGLVLTDAEGRIRQLNPEAERLLGVGCGLLVHAGRLTAARQDDARRLEALIGAACRQDAAARSGGSLGVSAPHRRLPLSITVIPLRSPLVSIFDEGPSAIVCITDLEAGVSLPEQRLIDLFALTPAEAKVALALLEGGGPREVAETLGVSFYTVRAHLAHIFEKTGASRQSELTGLLMRMIGADLG